MCRSHGRFEAVRKAPDAPVIVGLATSPRSSRFALGSGPPAQTPTGHNCASDEVIEGSCHRTNAAAFRWNIRAPTGMTRPSSTAMTRPFAPLHESGSVQVFSRRQRQSHHALRRPAAEKRQGTKSRCVGHWLAASPMGILISAPTSCAGERPTRRVHRLV